MNNLLFKTLSVWLVLGLFFSSSIFVSAQSQNPKKALNKFVILDLPFQREISDTPVGRYYIGDRINFQLQGNAPQVVSDSSLNDLFGFTTSGTTVDLKTGIKDTLNAKLNITVDKFQINDFNDLSIIRPRNFSDMTFRDGKLITAAVVANSFTVISSRSFGVGIEGETVTTPSPAPTTSPSPSPSPDASPSPSPSPAQDTQEVRNRLKERLVAIGLAPTTAKFSYNNNSVSVSIANRPLIIALQMLDVTPRSGRTYKARLERRTGVLSRRGENRYSVELLNISPTQRQSDGVKMNGYYCFYVKLKSADVSQLDFTPVAYCPETNEVIGASQNSINKYVADQNFGNPNLRSMDIYVRDNSLVRPLLTIKDVNLRYRENSERLNEQDVINAIFDGANGSVKLKLEVQEKLAVFNIRRNF